VGATNLKVTFVEHRAGAWTAVSRDQVPTRFVTDPEGVPDSAAAQLAEVAAATSASLGRIASIGIRVPGLNDPATGLVRPRLISDLHQRDGFASMSSGKSKTRSVCR